MITMSVSSRIYQACQLDMMAGEYGLTRVLSTKRGKIFSGTEAAWRRLADDVDYRSNRGWSDGRTVKSDGLHARIDRAVAKLV